MNTVIEELPVPDFEIDHPDEYAQYFLSNPREISFYLNLLVKRGCLVSAHIDAGQQFFLTAMVAVDEEKGEILIDPAQIETLNTAAGAARQITLAANLDRVKVQLRLGAMRESQFDGRRALSTDIPRTILRLQRREFSASNRRWVARLVVKLRSIRSAPMSELSNRGLPTSAVAGSA